MTKKNNIKNQQKISSASPWDPEGDLASKVKGLRKDQQVWDNFGDDDNDDNLQDLSDVDFDLKNKSIKLISEYSVDLETSGQNLLNIITSKLQKLSPNITIKSRWNNLHGQVKTTDLFFHFYINDKWYFDFNIYPEKLGNKWHFYF